MSTRKEVGRIKVSSTEVDRVLTMCDLVRGPMPTQEAVGRYDSKSGEVILYETDDQKAQCLRRTLECVGETHELERIEEGIEVTRGAEL